MLEAATVGEDRIQTVSAKNPPRKASIFMRLLKKLPTLFVLASLGGLGYWGHTTEWRFSYLSHKQPRESETGSDVSRSWVKVEKAAVRHTDSTFDPMQDRATIWFENEEATELAGIEVAPVWTSAMIDTIAAGGEMEFDADRIAKVSARASGTAYWVGVSVGDTVEKGFLLALIDAAQLGRAKVEFQQAMLQWRFKKELASKLRSMQKAIPARQLQEVEESLREVEGRVAGAEQALANFGLSIRASDHESTPIEEFCQTVRRLGISGTEAKWSDEDIAANLLPLRAPRSGVVLQSHVVTGELVEQGKPLFLIVNPAQMWLMTHVAMVDAMRVKLGQSAVFQPDGGKTEFKGKVDWIGTQADEASRTIPIRIGLANGSGQLRARMLGRCKIILREAPDAITVPNDSVQRLDGIAIVFVRDAGNMKEQGSRAFAIRPVKIGAKDDKNTEVLNGAQKGEVVAAKGSKVLLDILQSELRKTTKR